MTLEEIRKTIDQLDSQLLPLLTARLDCAREVAAFKKENNKPVLDPEREQLLLDSIESRAGEYGKEIRMIYTSFLAASRSLQHGILGSGDELRSLVQQAQQSFPAVHKVACQGAEGAYSHQAAARLCPDGEIWFHPAFEDVFRALEERTADIGILPVENSSAGSVAEVYDLILKYRFFIVGAVPVRASHCFAVPKGVTLAQVREVYSHPQALAQCTGFVRQNHFAAIPYSNTAAAAKMVAAQGGPVGVICSQMAAETYGLTILAHDIQNVRNNYTRFVAVCRDPIIPADAQKISLCFSLPHSTGSLSNVLSRFSLNGLNLTKIESRPLPDKPFEYDFYLDFTGSVHEPHTIDLIASLQEELPHFSFLGNYREME